MTRRDYKPGERTLLMFLALVGVVGGVCTVALVAIGAWKLAGWVW